MLIIEHEGSERFIQFAQRYEVLGVDEILFGFPDAPWSRQYFDVVTAWLTSKEMPFVIRETGEETTRRFAEVVVRGDAASVTGEVLTLATAASEAMGLDKDALFTVHLEGYNDHARWAWENRELLESQMAVGGIRARIAPISLRSLEGRRSRQG